MKTIGALVAVGALLVATPAVAQQHGHAQDQGEMHGMHGAGAAAQHCSGMSGGMSATTALQHRSDLQLSPDQVARLEAIQEEARAAATPHMEEAMSARAEAMGSLESAEPDLQGYESSLRRAADHMVQAHVAMAENTIGARGVLTAEQREKLAEFSHQMDGMMGDMGHTGGSMHQGMQHGGMAGMMDCPMMQGTPEPGPAAAGTGAE